MFEDDQGGLPVLAELVRSTLSIQLDPDQDPFLEGLFSNYPKHRRNDFCCTCAQSAFRRLIWMDQSPSLFGQNAEKSLEFCFVFVCVSACAHTMCPHICTNTCAHTYILETLVFLAKSESLQHPFFNIYQADRTHPHYNDLTWLVFRWMSLSPIPLPLQSPVSWLLFQSLAVYSVSNTWAWITPIPHFWQRQWNCPPVQADTLLFHGWKCLW